MIVFTAYFPVGVVVMSSNVQVPQNEIYELHL